MANSNYAMLTMSVVVQTWGNRADALVRQAELLGDVSGEGNASRQAYNQAMEAYSVACSMTSSEQGDDLPGLLHNWGVGLRSMADHDQVQIYSLLPTQHMLQSYQHSLSIGLDLLSVWRILLTDMSHCASCHRRGRCR